MTILNLRVTDSVLICAIQQMLASQEEHLLKLKLIYDLTNKGLLPCQDSPPFLMSGPHRRMPSNQCFTESVSFRQLVPAALSDN